jgi:hypothetical protein
MVLILILATELACRTVDYYDDVLCAKLKRLVYATSLLHPGSTLKLCSSSGAVKRSKLENDEPTITYEAFIEELDEGWCFFNLARILALTVHFH